MTDTNTPDPAGQQPAGQQPADPDRALEIAREVAATDWQVSDEPEPLGAEGEDIAWMADPDAHLSDVEPHEPDVVEIDGPLPVCDYSGEGDEPCEEPTVQRRWSGAAVVTAAAVGAVVGGLFVAAALVWALGLLPNVKPLALGRGASSDAPTVPVQNRVQITPGSVKADISEAVAAKVVPSVVNVTIKQAGIDPLTGARITQEAGNGSGVIIRDDGYVLTNNHVVQGADEIIVTVGVEDKKATVVGTDPSSDLAVLKIEGSGEASTYPAVEVGSSKNLKVGQYVMAVGSPFGLDKTATVGIVSALDRTNVVQDRTDLTTYTNLIQTDAAINPGNSGGALVNAAGELVGINTLIESPSGAVGTPQSAGIGFAIPVDFAIDIAKQLIESGKATHAYLGVSTATVDQSAARQFNLPVSSGALVRFVQPDSPAEKAGIERGDIVVRFGTKKVESAEDMYAAIREHRIGDTVEVELVRGDTSRTMPVTLASDAIRN